MASLKVGVLYQNGGLLALNKPAGLSCEIVPRPPHSTITELWMLVRERFPDGNLAHRIDRYTTGITLAGETREIEVYLRRNWHEVTRKLYLAVIREPDWEGKIVSKPLDGKVAVTSFKVLDHFKSLALVQCQLTKNGRYHQIRRHLKLLGSPIVGDQKYGGKPTTVRDGQLLHAWRMEVRLPDNGKLGDWTTIQAPIPADFRQFPFDWDQWNVGANEVLEEWPVPLKIASSLRSSQ